MEISRKIELDFFSEQEKEREKTHKKSCKRVSKARRLLEDREEIKRLNELCGNEYWEEFY